MYRTVSNPLIVLLAIVPCGAFPVAAQQGYTLTEVSFLAGCWSGQMGSLHMREQWTEAEGGMMLGTTRFYQDGSVAGFEFAMMSEGEDGVTLWPYPSGTRSEHGFPLVRAEGEYVFENLEHDFPVRIIYVREGDSGLRPRIEGRDGESRGWELERTACPG